MTKKTSDKKTGQGNRLPVQDQPAKDWHWKDVLVALHKAGWSLRQLAIAHGYDDGAPLGEAARRPFPKAEGIIANALNLQPQVIWPSRYDTSGAPNRRRGPAPRRPDHFQANPIRITHKRNPQTVGAR
ncbi:hypothetical protein C7S18_12345 [Ahniella affigens]|uniref:Ner winged helix-turn-helix DNA-binding domain-containing protein n=1 Tax=Ahniella affigens TaxID=2021234 RepID=A0A2P1PSZ3_9GAMM|nr:hypothetical protein C7S18_12345 [Ahniella affigens]